MDAISCVPHRPSANTHAPFRSRLLLDHTNRTTLPVCASHGGNIAAALACVLGKQSLIDRGSIKP
jgi:hypothetical protein